MIFDFNRGFNDKAIGEMESMTQSKEQPIVAISANVIDENSALHRAYSDAIIASGGVPIIIPHTCDYRTIQSLVKQVDGVLFSGGADFDARYFGEENIDGLTEYNSQRDYHEFMLLRAAIDCGLPILGICRGFQLFNIALGGDIYQDLPSQYPTPTAESENKPLLQHSILTNKHLGVHNVTVVEGSILHNIIGSSEILVNSRHHQGVKNIAPSLRCVAYSEDGLVEALEGYPEHKILGVQWHPENMATLGECKAMQRLFSFFVGEAELYRLARKIHKYAPIVDSHCDTPMLYESSGFNLSCRNSSTKVDLVKMEEGLLDATITVAYIPQSTPIEHAPQKTFEILDRFSKDVAAHPDRATIVRSVEELLRAKSNGLKSIMLGVENGLAIGRDITNLERLKGLGVVYITLCHNGSNAICDSAAGEKPHQGVSEFGREVIARMNELGITIDISHSSHDTTMQVVELSRQPIIASHSSCKSLCDHRRNLYDEAICAIAKSGGVVQICGYGGFLSRDKTASIVDLVAHIEYAISLVGYNHVGIGSDFDGDGGVAGFDGANDFISLTVELLRRGHKEADVAKIMGGNILRVLSHNIRN